MPIPLKTNTFSICLFSVNSNLSKVEVKLNDFLTTELKDKLISDVKLPPLSSNNLIRTYKVNKANKIKKESMVIVMQWISFLF